MPEGQQFTHIGRQVVAISPDGTRIAYVANVRLYLRALSDIDARPIPGSEDAAGVLNPVFSPDGRSIASVSPDGKRVAFHSDDGREAVIWVYDLDGATAMRRLNLGNQNRFPVWTPDGQRITFQSTEGSDASIFWQRADGTGMPERLTTAKGGSHIPHSWSPDGNVLLFSTVSSPSASREQASVRTLSRYDRSTKQTGAFGNVRSRSPISPIFSPDGRWFAYASTESTSAVLQERRGRTNIYVQPFPVTGAIYEIGPGFGPVWSRDGKQLLFVASAGISGFDVVNITTAPAFAVGKPVNIPLPISLFGAASAERTYDMAADGRVLGLATPMGDQAEPNTPRINVAVNGFTELQQRVPTR